MGFYLRRYALNTTSNGHLNSFLIAKAKSVPFSMREVSSKLPKLPVPPLSQTLDKFLAVAKPIVSADEYDETVTLVKAFARAGGEGEKLQKLLIERSQKTDNWLADWWLSKAYLDLRMSVVINISPGLSFPLQRFEGPSDQVRFAARLIPILLEYKHMIDSGELPQDFAGGKPMDMMQYHYLFGTCRIPKTQSDTLSFENHDSPSRHIIVAINGSFFELTVYDENGSQFNEHELFRILFEMFRSSQKRTPSSELVGLLTSEDRDCWAKVYKSLEKNEENASSLRKIRDSLFLVCIDSAFHSNGDKQSVMNDVHAQVIHGGGSHLNSGNRWFDKTLQFVIGANGGCGITYEHSPAEGPPIAALSDYVLARMNQQEKRPVVSFKDSEKTPNTLQAHKLNFVLTEEDKGAVQKAAQKLDRIISNLEVEFLSFEQFGSDYLKSHKLSPDSFLQVAFQLAFWKIHGKTPPTYETGTLRTFWRGRTDTIRLPLIETDEFVHSTTDPSKSLSEKAEALRKAVAAHKNYAIAACSGNGIDRHLLGLKLIAQENGLSIPEIFDSTAYKTSLHFLLSTSQVSCKHDCCMIFGPMYEDCYGLCYNPHPSKIHFGVTAYKSFASTSALLFVKKLSESLLEMREVLEAQLKSRL